MKKMKRFLLSLLAIIPLHAIAVTFNPILEPVCVTNPAQHVFVDGQPTPLNQPYMALRYQLPTVANSLTYHVGYYTEYNPLPQLTRTSLVM